MALVVETGSGSPTAESYLSVAECDSYHTAFGNTGWTGTTSAKEIALRHGTQYLDARFNGNWRGTRKLETQGLAWPRYDVTDSDGWYVDSDSLPLKLKQATAELALTALTTALMPNLTSPGSLSSSSLQVGSIRIAEEYMAGQSQVTAFRKVDALLREYVWSGTRIERS